MKTKNKSLKATAKSKTTTSKGTEKKRPVTKKSASSPPVNQQKEFPGYPRYSAADDITRKGERIDADIEATKLSTNRTDAKITNNSDKITNQSNSIESDEENEISTDPYAVTKEDLEALGSTELEELNMDEGDDAGLKRRVTPVDFAGSDLDIPGSELDDNAEAVGSEDEENNSYSVGGDSHNDLEEDQS